MIKNCPPLLALLILLHFACTDWDLHRVGFTEIITVGVIEVEASSAFLLGDIDGLRNGRIIESGFVLSPIASDEESLRLDEDNVVSIISESMDSISQDRAFAARATELSGGTLYYFRSYVRLEGEEIPVYGGIDSFTTLKISLKIKSIEGSGQGCPTEAIVHLSLELSGIESTALQFGIVWRNDVTTEPTSDDNVLYGSSVDQTGNAIVKLPVDCGEFYSVRSFIQLPEKEISYGKTREFTAQPGGSWFYLGEIPQRFESTQGFRSFSSGQKGYILGIREGVFEAVFWKYDSITKTWTELNEPGVVFSEDLWLPRSIERVIAGFRGVLHEYHPASDHWVSLGDFATLDALDVEQKDGFIYQNKMYFPKGSGNSFGYIQLANPGNFIPVQSYPGTSLNFNISFLIDNRGYLGMGVITFDIPRDWANDIWQFNLDLELWERIADFPVSVLPKIAFSIDEKGYVLSGSEPDGKPYPGFWLYDPVVDKWSKLTDFGRGDGSADIGFVIDGIAYGGLGTTIDGLKRQEFWKYIPELDR